MCMLMHHKACLHSPVPARGLASSCTHCECIQVDTHVHHSACMHQKHLLRFIKSKLRKEPGEVVIFRDGKYLTLLEVFESLNLTGCACLPSPAAVLACFWIIALQWASV